MEEIVESLAKYLNTTSEIAQNMLKSQENMVNKDGIIQPRVGDIFTVEYPRLLNNGIKNIKI